MKVQCPVFNQKNESAINPIDNSLLDAWKRSVNLTQKNIEVHEKMHLIDPLRLFPFKDYTCAPTYASIEVFV